MRPGHQFGPTPADSQAPRPNFPLSDTPAGTPVGRFARLRRLSPGGRARLAIGATVLQGLFAGLPWVGLLLFVHRYAVDVPCGDHWCFVPHYTAWVDGRGTLGHLWEHQNGHRSFFSRLILFSMARATGWDTRAETLLSVVLSLGILLALWRCLHTRSGPSFGWLLPLLSLFVCSLHAMENWLFGWQVHFLSCTLGVVWSLSILSGPRIAYRHLAVAAAAGIFASYCIMNGFLVWPLGLLLLVLSRDPPGMGRWRACALWAAAGGVTLLLHVLTLPAGSLPIAGWADLRAVFTFVCKYLGSGLLGYEPDRVFVPGAIGLATFLACLAVVAGVPACRTPRNLAFVGLGLFAVASALLTGLGRVHLGTDAAVASRYTSFSIYLWIALLVLPVALAAQTRNVLFIAGSIASLFLICRPLVETQAWAFHRGLNHRGYLLQVRNALLEGRGLSFGLVQAFTPQPRELGGALELLRERKLSLFRDCAEEQRWPPRAEHGPSLEVRTEERGSDIDFVLVSHGHIPGNLCATFLVSVDGRSESTVVDLGEADAEGRRSWRSQLAREPGFRTCSFVTEGMNRYGYLERSPSVTWRR